MSQETMLKYIIENPLISQSNVLRAVGGYDNSLIIQLVKKGLVGCVRQKTRNVLFWTGMSIPEPNKIIISVV